MKKSFTFPPLSSPASFCCRFSYFFLYLGFIIYSSIDKILFTIFNYLIYCFLHTLIEQIIACCWTWYYAKYRIIYVIQHRKLLFSIYIWEKMASDVSLLSNVDVRAHTIYGCENASAETGFNYLWMQNNRTLHFSTPNFHTRVTSIVNWWKFH